MLYFYFSFEPIQSLYNLQSPINNHHIGQQSSHEDYCVVHIVYMSEDCHNKCLKMSCIAFENRVTKRFLV